MNSKKIEKLVEELLIELDEDPKREGLIKTPKRVAEVLKFITSGYNKKPKDAINGALFTQDVNNMIIVKDIEIYSTCEHHMLPFFGICHIGYIAQGRVLGISKIARIVDIFARRLQLQERITEQIAHAILDELKPLGVGVVIEARHLCMMMRGVEKQQSSVITSSVLGTFRTNAATRQEFFSNIGKSKG